MGLFLVPFMALWPIRYVCNWRSGHSSSVKSLAGDLILPVFALGFCINLGASLKFWIAFSVAGLLALLFLLRPMINQIAVEMLEKDYLAEGRGAVVSQSLAKADVAFYGGWLCLSGLRKKNKRPQSNFR